MKNRKRKLVWVMLFLWCMLIPVCMASEYDSNAVLESQFNLFDWGGLDEIEAALKESAPHASTFDLESEVRDLVTGESKFSLDYVIDKVGMLFMSELGTYLKLIARFALIAIMCSLLQTLSSSFKTQQTTKAAFFVCYMMVILVISQSLFVVVGLAQTIIDNLSMIMGAALPTLLAFMAISGYITSSSALATVMIAAMNIMTWAISNLVLPVVIALIV